MPPDEYADLIRGIVGRDPQERVRRIARQSNIPDDIAEDYLSTTKVESGHNVNVRDSPKGAQGFGQVMPDAPGGTTRTVGGRKYNLRDPDQNIEAGLRYFAEGGNDPVRRRLYYFGGPRAARTYDRTGRIPNISDGNMTAAQYVKATGAGRVQPRSQQQPTDDEYSKLIRETVGSEQSAVPPVAQPRGRFAAMAQANPMPRRRSRPKQTQVDPADIAAQISGTVTSEVLDQKRPPMSIADVRQRDNEAIQRAGQQPSVADIKRRDDRIAARLREQYAKGQPRYNPYQVAPDVDTEIARQVDAEIAREREQQQMEANRPKVEALKTKLREFSQSANAPNTPMMPSSRTGERAVQGVFSALANSGVQLGNLVSSDLTEEMRIAQQALAELEAEDPDKGWIAAAERALPNAAIELAKMSTLSRVPVAGRATLPTLGALSEADQGVEAAAKGAAIGELYHRGFGAMRNLPKPVQFGLGTAVPAGVAIAQGADPKAALIENTAFGAMALAGGRRPQPISRRPMPEVRTREAAPPLRPSELQRRTELRVRGEGRDADMGAGARPTIPEVTPVDAATRGAPTGIEASVGRQPVGAPIERGARRSSEMGREGVTNAPPTKAASLTRNFRAGPNNAEMVFESDVQRDLYDLGAKMRYQMRGGRNRASQRDVGDIEGLKRSLVERGVPEVELTNRAFETLDDVRTQMRGVKDGETRQVKDKFAPQPPVQARVEGEPNPVVSHSNPRIDGGEIVGKTKSGKLLVKNNEGGTSEIKNPRTQGNREAAIIKPRTPPTEAAAQPVKATASSAPEWVKIGLRRDFPDAPEAVIEKAASRTLGKQTVPDVDFGDGRYRKNGFWNQKGVEGFMGGKDTQVTDPQTQARWDIEYELSKGVLPAAEGGQKPPWEMTQADYLERGTVYRGRVPDPRNPSQTIVRTAPEPFEGATPVKTSPKDIGARGFGAAMHKRVVETALREGKPVPESVLRDYPDLVSRQGGPTEPATPPPTAVKPVQRPVQEGAAKSTPSPPPPKSVPPIKPERKLPETTSVKNAATAELRRDLELLELEGPERKSWQTTIDNALAKGLDKKAEEIADRVIRSERKEGLSDEEAAGVQHRLRELENEFEDRYKANSADPKLNDLKARIANLTRATNEGGTAPARALNFRRSAVDKEFRLINVITRMEAAKGRELNPKELSRYEDMVKQRDTAIQQRDAALEKARTAQIQKQIDRVARQRVRAETKQALDEEAAVIKQNIAAEFARLKSQNIQASGLAGLDPEGVITRNLLRYARNRVKANVGIKAEQLIDDVHSLVKDFVDRRQVAELISGYKLQAPERQPEDVRRLGEIRSEIKKLLTQEDVAAAVRTEKPQGVPRRLFSRNEQRLKQLQAKEADLARRIEQRDFSKPEKTEPLPYTREVQRAQERVSKLDNQLKAEELRADPWHWLREVSGMRKAGMLSGLWTHVKNITGTGAYQGFEEVRRLPSVVADAAISTFTGRRTVTLSPTAMLDGVIQAATKGRRQAGEILRVGATKEQLERQQLHEINTGVKAVDLAFNSVFRFMSASDVVFYNHAYARNLAERAQAQALSERRTNRSLNWKERAKELRSDEQIQADSKHDALVATFNNNNRLSDAIKRGRGAIGPVGNFALDMVLPFDRTPTNVIARVIEASPLGYGKNAKQLAKSAWKRSMSPAEQRAISETFGRATTGTAVITMGFALAVRGLISTDDYGNAYLNLGKRQINLNGIAPMGTLMATGAGLYTESRKRRKSRNYLKPIAKPIVDQPILQATTQVTDVVKDPERSAARTGARTAFSFVPFSGAVRTVAEATDPIRRKPKGFKEEFQRNIPILRRSLKKHPVQTIGRRR